MTASRPMGILDTSSELVRLLAEYGPLSPGEIAQHIGMPRSSVYRLVEALGRTLPLHAGAAGRVTLAHLEDPESYLELAPFEPFTAHTLVDAGALRADIAKTRSQGFSISDQDVTEGIGALGVAVTSGRRPLRRGPESGRSFRRDIRPTRGFRRGARYGH